MADSFQEMWQKTNPGGVGFMDGKLRNLAASVWNCAVMSVCDRMRKQTGALPEEIDRIEKQLVDTNG